jgi:hypothetical protein
MCMQTVFQRYRATESQNYVARGDQTGRRRGIPARLPFRMQGPHCLSKEQQSLLLQPLTSLSNFVALYAQFLNRIDTTQRW